MNALQLYQQDPEAVLDELLKNDPRLRSEHTRMAYRQGVQGFNRWRGDRVVSKSTLLEYMAHLQAEGRAVQTINLMLAAVRWYARTVSDMAQDYSDDDAVIDDLTKKAARVLTVRVLPVDHGKAGRFIEPGELQALLEVCRKDRTDAGIRDASILSLLWASGMRRSELCHLTLADLKEHDDGYEIQIVRGKGGKSRTAFVTNGAAKYLDDWLSIRGDAPGYVFVPLDKGHKGRESRALTGEALGYMLGRRCEAAGISEPTKLHDFRRSFCSLLWDANVDGSTLMRMMGHSSPVTTANYDRRSEGKQREAARLVYVPYFKK